MAIKVRPLLRKGGWLEQWLDYTAEFEYPESYALFAILAVASAAINGRILVNAGYKPETLPNIFVLLYGPSGARKSEALFDAVQDVLAEAVAEGRLPVVPILPMNVTPEALRQRLARDSKMMGCARGIVVSEEFTSLIGGADYMKHGAEFLSKIWETPRAYESFGTIAHGEVEIKHRYVVIGACTTPKSFRTLNLDALEGGLMRRMLVVSELDGQKEAARPRRNTVLLNRIRGTFCDRLALARFDSVTMDLSKGAVALNDEWYTNDLRRLRSRVVGEKASKFINSLQVHAFKLAAIHEVVEGGRAEEMSEESLRFGFGLVEALLPGTVQVYDALVPTAFARLKASGFEILAASRRPLSDLQLDVAIGAEAGVNHAAAGEARKALIAEGRIGRRGDGLLEVNNDGNVGRDGHGDSTQG